MNLDDVPAIFIIIICSFLVGMFFLHQARLLELELADSAAENFCREYSFKNGLEFVKSGFHYDVSRKMVFDCESSIKPSSSFGGASKVEAVQTQEAEFSVTKTVLIKWICAEEKEIE